MTITMSAKEAAEQVYENISREVAVWKSKGIVPRIDTILVEGDPASAYYAQAKSKIAKRLNIEFQLHSFPADVTEDEILKLIQQLNKERLVHGIMLELPLPKHISTAKIEQSISPAKDIDGVTPQNKLAVMTGEDGLYPATPQACIKLLKYYGYPLTGKNVTLVGRGQTVGLPLFHLLQRENATVTVCHSRTKDIALHLAHAEIVFSAVGRLNVIDKEMVHSKLVIVDAGINELEEGKITGDVSLEVDGYVTALSPVPGGVGTLTTAVLYENLMKAVEIQLGEES